MTLVIQKTRNDTDYRFTIEQIAKLEHAIMSVRETQKAPSEIIDIISSIQYKEILRLRAELDMSLGFGEKDENNKLD